jgi:hypothetical protein
MEKAFEWNDNKPLDEETIQRIEQYANEKITNEQYKGFYLGGKRKRFSRKSRKSKSTKKRNRTRKRTMKRR